MTSREMDRGMASVCWAQQDVEEAWLLCGGRSQGVKAEIFLIEAVVRDGILGWSRADRVPRVTTGPHLVGDCTSTGQTSE